MKHKTTREHYYKYKRMVERNGVNIEGSPLVERYDVKALYLEDPNLNNIPLKIFDGYWYGWWASNRNPEIGPNSPAECVCMYKHALIFDYLGVEPEFVDKEE